ncbi:disease resistance protein [Corchorus olitorius]|uniref:Disease resistance protein n=1 Tax=Corchorus olitorius TaxID=93759 RepID=A0A1R3K9M6_9ROSI|nr:disease resistance protein [Corchorus olitorius]
MVLNKCDALRMEPLPCGLQELKIGDSNINDSVLEQMMQPCTSLERLCISECGELKSLPKGSLPIMLKQLSIEKSNALDCSKILMYTSLESLEIKNQRCNGMESFPLGSFPLLNRVTMWGCEDLKWICAVKEEGGPFSSLNLLRIYECPNFVSFQKFDGFCAPELTLLELLGCENLNSLPDKMHSLFPSLKVLAMYKCPKIEGFPKEGLPSSLKYLSIKRLIASRTAQTNWKNAAQLSYIS